MTDKEIIEAWVVEVRHNHSDGGHVACAIALGNSTVVAAVKAIRDCAAIQDKAVRENSPRTAFPESLRVLATDLERRIPAL